MAALGQASVWATSEMCIRDRSDCGFLVLQYENGGVVGYDFTYRQMIDLKKDGTFGYLYGVADTGYARLNFTDDSWEYIKI